VFFDVDSAYYMGQIHALLRDVSWPPISLDFAGEQTGYHYGAQCLCAVLSQLTGILPHTVAFIIYMPLTALGIISASWLLVQSNLPDRLLLWLGLALLLFQCFYPLYKVGFIINSFHDWGQQFLQLFLDPETLNGGYPMLSSYYGVFLTLTLLICLQNLSDFGALRLAAFAVGIMVLYKSPYMVTVGLGLGLCISWHLLFTRQKRAALAFMAFPLAYLLHALMLLSSTVSLVVLFGHLIANKRLWVDVLGTMAVYSIPIFVLWRTRKLQFKNAGTWYPLVFVVASIIFANVFGLVRKEDNLEFGTGIDQTVHLTPVFLAVFLVGNLQEYWMDLTRNKRFLVICMVLSITLFPIIHNIFESGVYLFSPEIGHEYVDNRPLAEALQHIPLENSRIVVNDFHYPAQNYRRDFRQMQIPALFGHQAYAVNFEYVHYPESKYRLEIQQRFRAAKWDAGLEQIAQKLGWTDLIIFRNFPHPDDIPLPLMFENNLCQVYSFK